MTNGVVSPLAALPDNVVVHLQAIITVLSLVNPAVCAGMFMRIESGRSKEEHLKDATQVSAAVLVILVLAAFVGVQFLHQFGISLDAFKVAGDPVLSWMVFNMLGAKHDRSPDSSHAGGDSPSLTPLILFAACRFMGLIVLAMGVPNALTGLKSFFGPLST